MPVRIDELNVQTDVVSPSQSTSGGAPPSSAARIAESVRAALARLAQLEARTRAERYDD
jgi:hypothetical protein